MLGSGALVGDCDTGALLGLIRFRGQVDDFEGEVFETFGLRVVCGAEDGDGFAGIAAQAGIGVERNFGEQRNIHFLGGESAAALAEDVELFAVVFEVTHVFNDAENLFAHLFKHVDGFAGIFKSDIGRSGDDNGTGERGSLNESELDVAGARREIDDEIVEFAPIDVTQELLNHRIEHGAAPDERFVARI